MIPSHSATTVSCSFSCLNSRNIDVASKLPLNCFPVIHSLFPQDDYKSNPNIQISELTSSDKCAREIWRNNGGKKSASIVLLHPSYTVRVLKYTDFNAK